jgi:hypothetical protein
VLIHSALYAQFDLHTLTMDRIEHLDSRRFELCSKLHVAIMEPFMTRQFATLNVQCNRAANAMGSYATALRDTGVFPYDLEFSTHGFRCLLDSSHKLPTEVPRCSGGRQCICRTDDCGSMSREMIATSNEIERRKSWYSCIDCLKTEGVSMFEGKCRIQHYVPEFSQ